MFRKLIAGAAASAAISLSILPRTPHTDTVEQNLNSQKFNTMLSKRLPSGGNNTNHTITIVNEFAKNPSKIDQDLLQNRKWQCIWTNQRDKHITLRWFPSMDSTLVGWTQTFKGEVHEMNSTYSTGVGLFRLKYTLVAKGKAKLNGNDSWAELGSPKVRVGWLPDVNVTGWMHDVCDCHGKPAKRAIRTLEMKELYVDEKIRVIMGPRTGEYFLFNVEE